MARPTSSKTATQPTIAADAPLFTTENFEKELQALAAKAKEETWGKWARAQAGVLLHSATLLTLAAVYSNISQLTLAPVYGGIPVSVWHSQGVMAACFIGWASNLFIQRQLPVKPVQLLPLIAAYIPTIQYFFFKFSDTLGPRLGPPITESLTFFPLLLLSVSCTATVLDDLELRGGSRWQWLSEAGPGIGSYAFYKTAEYFSGKFIPEVIGSTIVLSRIGLQLLMAGIYSVFSPSKILLFAIPALLHTSLFNVHNQAPWTTSSLNATLANSGWKLIDRQDSNTGVISVIESSTEGFRAMRCDHSLLGGEWLTANKGSTVKEPIYGVFVMLEAVRLVEVPNPIEDTQANALVIGLGIGTTPVALMAHGVWTDIVEIDPVVHDFATKYFGLPTTHTRVIEDAVPFAQRMVSAGRKWDYIVHDVFTGGAEPVELFTLEFLQDLRSILNPGGVIAINYAGDFLLPPARIIIKTIRAVFPTCRIFRESEVPSAETLQTEKRDFTNMVIFCTNSPLEKLTFRDPTERDLLGSGARETFLVPKLEVDMHLFEERHGDGGVLLRNETRRFAQWQQQSAMGHWAVMRTVLPKVIWENW